MASNFHEELAPDWCPGCGDFGILNAVKMALDDMELENHDVAIFSGIGCSGKTSHYVKAYGVHTLHGRVLPFATGAKLAAPRLTVVAVGGDGDGYGIGAGHFVSAGRRNLDMAYIVFDNEVYGLTKGQAAPTLGRGEQTKSLSQPNIHEGVNPLATAIAAGYTWVGRGYAFDVKQLKKLILAAIKHPGAALLDVLQPCPTYNDLHTQEYFTPRVYDLNDDGHDGSVSDPLDEEEVAEKKGAAMLKAMEKGDKWATGVFYQMEAPTYEQRIAARMPHYPETAPATADWIDDEGRPTTDIAPFMAALHIA